MICRALPSANFLTFERDPDALPSLFSRPDASGERERHTELVTKTVEYQMALNKLGALVRPLRLALEGTTLNLYGAQSRFDA